MSRPLLVYVAARVALFVVVLALLRLAGVEGLTLVALAVLLSALLGVVLLRRQRDELTAAIEDRHRRRRAGTDGPAT